MNTRQRANISLTALATLCLAQVGGPSQAQATIFNTRPAFSTANPGLPTEGFEAGIIPSSQIQQMPGNTLDKNTNNSYFSTGSILDGLRLTAVNSGGAPSSTNLDLAGGTSVHASGDNTKVIVVDVSTDSLNVLLYNNNATAVGFDLGAFSSNGAYTVSVFNGTTLLRTDSFSPAANTYQFVGYTALQPITRVNISSNFFESIDNVSFGVAGVATPEPGSIALLTGFGISACVFVKRRKR